MSPKYLSPVGKYPRGCAMILSFPFVSQDRRFLVLGEIYRVIAGLLASFSWTELSFLPCPGIDDVGANERGFEGVV